VLERLSAAGAPTVVLPRTDEQRRGIAGLGIPGVVVPARAVDGRSLVALSDLVVSAGGTMIREAAVLGTPAWSIFEGRLGAMDELLEREGKLRFLREPSELVIEPKPTDAWRERVRRDPAELLELALP
jgi:uncharacterized protein